MTNGHQNHKAFRQQFVILSDRELPSTKRSWWEGGRKRVCEAAESGLSQAHSAKSRSELGVIGGRDARA